MPDEKFGPGDINSNALPIDVASAYLNVREDGKRPNRGPQIDRFLRTAGLEPDNCKDAAGYSWCAAFVYTCFKEAGIKIPKTALVKKLWDLSEDNRVEAPEPGDVFIHLAPDGKKGHTGIVKEVHDDGSITSIDGNTNQAGSSNGDGVYIKKRSKDYFIGFLRFI